ncbi:hypothetical protein BKA64DRAFT_709303 [Cadophora sp. MPI-SDFR-AT-0126]|nr:hypothetical protein BKA64DRAFT_709303 [Leotiomycetes sp. MPI-SDFR-AT-0126]
MAYPQLVAFDLDGTIWGGSLQLSDFCCSLEWVTRKARDSLGRSWDQITDKRTGKIVISVSNDVSEIFKDLARRNVQIFVVSRHKYKSFCISAMKLMPFFSRLVQSKSYEIYDYPLHEHQKKLRYFLLSDGTSSAQNFNRLGFAKNDAHSCSSMIKKSIATWSCGKACLCPAVSLEHQLTTYIGVTFQKVSNRNVGITTGDYHAGLDLWRRNQNIRRPMPSSGLNPHPSQKQIGWVGTDKATGELYSKGRRRPKSTRPSRWGWGLYVADDPFVAAAFTQYQREHTPDDQYICQVFVRDFEVFKQMDKVWVAEDGSVPMTDICSGDDSVAESQHIRDNIITQSFAVRKPYILFSRHTWTDVLFRTWRVQSQGRFSEMVVYPQIQDALFYAEPLKLSSFLASAEVQGTTVLGFDFRHQLFNWGIKWNENTRADFEIHSETNW